MKFLVVLSVLVIQCAATKSWNGDSYSEETFSVFGWIGYLKRLSLIALMFVVVILYYVPESRPHARRICYSLIDFTANGLKSALSTRESEYMYEKIRSRYNRAKYEQSLIAQKRQSQINQNDENFMTQNHGKRTSFISDALIGGRDKKKVSEKHSKDHRFCRHHRSAIIKDSSPTSSMDVDKSAYLYSDKLDDLQKYMKTNPTNAKRSKGATIENYALLISGTPQQMAMLDQKCEKDDVIIVQDPYLRLEYKECGTSTDKLSSKADASGSEQEGPTRDHNDHGMETYVKDVDLCSIPESTVLRHSDYKNLYQTNQYQCGECCSGNESLMSSVDLNAIKETIHSISPDIKNILKLSKSVVHPKPYKKVEENSESAYHVNHDKYNDTRLQKSNNLTNNRKVDFLEEDKEASQKREGAACQQENTSRCVRRKKPRNGDSVTGFCCSDISYFTDRGGDADDENSQHGATAKHELDERPQRETYVFDKNSDDSIFDLYEDFCTKPILKSTFQLLPRVEA
ncbi:uncharacterized protein LOC143188360 [Calliopsis andreniformis]|uniref:uncharacterized protein LOC143188360 n=1 Tax=Calliopsis andreniformis TaxID=337506 RepID=UPI003FCE2B58